MIIKINQLKVGVHQIKTRFARHLAHRLGHRLQGRKVGRRIQSLARIPPGLGQWIEGPWRKSLQRGNVTNMVATSLRNRS